MVISMLLSLIDVLGNSSIGFVRVFENKIAPHICESGTQKLKKAITDHLLQGIIYGLTQENQILIFEMKQHGNKQDTLECKVIG